MKKGLEEEKLYSGANGKLNFTITIGSKPMNNEKITFNATAGLQVISDIIQVGHTFCILMCHYYVSFTSLGASQIVNCR